MFIEFQAHLRIGFDVRLFRLIPVAYALLKIVLL